MSYKLKPQPQPVNTNVRTHVEACIIELFIGLLCAGFAYFTHDKELVLFAATSIIAVICFLLTLHNIYLLIQDLRAQKKQTNTERHEAT